MGAAELISRASLQSNGIQVAWVLPAALPQRKLKGYPLSTPMLRRATRLAIRLRRACLLYLRAVYIDPFGSQYLALFPRLDVFF
jgi:hypothetical protein